MSDSEDLKAEVHEWIESLDYVLANRTPEQVNDLLQKLQSRISATGIDMPFSANTPYLNTINRAQQPPYPGSREIERRIKNIVRWNAMAMVTRANRDKAQPGGHISTYASSATLYEVGYNHFFRAPTEEHPGDQIYFQGHAAPGMYALYLHNNRIGDEGARALADALRGNTTVTVISLGHNLIGYEGTRALATRVGGGFLYKREPDLSYEKLVVELQRARLRERTRGRLRERARILEGANLEAVVRVVRPAKPEVRT